MCGDGTASMLVDPNGGEKKLIGEYRGCSHMFTFRVTIFSSFLRLFVELVQEMEIDDLSDLGEEGEEEDEEPWYSDMSLKHKSLILSDQLGNRPHTN